MSGRNADRDLAGWVQLPLYVGRALGLRSSLPAGPRDTPWPRRVPAVIRPLRLGAPADRVLVPAFVAEVFDTAGTGHVPASVAVLIGTFASVITLTSVMWFIQSGRLVFP